MILNTIKASWQRTQLKFGYKRTRAVALLLAIGFMALSVHLLFVGGLGQSALLYMLLPYTISVLIAATRSYEEQVTVGRKYWRHIVSTLVVFLAASVILREGFICVLMFLPIYLVFVSLAFAMIEINNRQAAKKNRLSSIALPLLIVLVSLEGTSGALSLPRENTVQRIRVTELSVDQIKANLEKPLDLERERHWFLAIFPMPVQASIGRLEKNTVHRVKTRYHRWFFTNTHEGEAELLMEDISDTTIRTRLLSDTTYFASYLRMHGSEIVFTTLDDGGTHIDFKIHYQRKLDPAWYFHPMQQYAVGKMADLLIDQMMLRP